MPYGMIGANIGYAMLATRYTHEYGLRDEQRAKVAVDQRRNANANPDAIFHDKTLTVEEVLASEMICEPLHMLEIVMPSAGAAALLIQAYRDLFGAWTEVDFDWGQGSTAWLVGAKTGAQAGIVSYVAGAITLGVLAILYANSAD